jgi:hypothetical protein
MNFPKFRSGQELNSTLLNQLSDGIRRAQVTSVIGGTFSSTPGGTAIMIDAQTRGGSGSTVVCPFQVTTANEGEDWKFKIEFGLIGGKIPTGMFAGGVPALIMDWTDGWVLAAVTFVADQVTVDTVTFTVNADIPANTATIAYYPIAYILTDSTGGTPTQVIQNLCATPVPSVFDLLFVPPKT